MKKYKKAYIEITNICNLNCSFCPKTTRQAKYMSLEEFKYIVIKVAKCADYINLHQMGEPLLHKNLPEILQFSKENNIKINITTNGTLLSRKKAKMFCDNSLNKISISLHSFEANKIDDTYNLYLNNILEFVDELTKNSDTYCCLRLWNMENSKTNTFNNDIFKILEKYFTMNILNNIGTLKHIKLKERVFLQLDEEFKWPDIEINDVNSSGFCYGLRDHFSVLCDGTVVPCCLDNNGEINLGNIFYSPLEEILQSKRAKNIYENFSNRKVVESLCKKCNYINKFNKKH